jgi:hypothetical protein
MSSSSTPGPTKPRPVELFATIGLALSTLIALTAVSIGIARADGLRVRVASQPAPFIALHR